MEHNIQEFLTIIKDIHVIVIPQGRERQGKKKKGRKEGRKGGRKEIKEKKEKEKK